MRQEGYSSVHKGPDPSTPEEAMSIIIAIFDSFPHMYDAATQVANVNDDLVHAWLAAEAYRDTHGRFPPRLKVAGFTNRLDPYSKKPYLYQARGAAMKVWSVGMGGIDHGGVQSPSFDSNIVLSIGLPDSSGS